MSAAAGAAPGTRRARVLAHLAAHPGLTTYELERALGTGPSTRELLHDMERKAQVIAVMEWRPQQGRHVSAWYVAPPGTVPAPSAERTEHLRRLRREAQRRRRARAAVMPGPAAVACLPPGAACKGADPALFFGAEAEKPWERPAREAEAKAICARCSIRLRCFDLARANGERWGIWGGVDFQGEGGAEGVMTPFDAAELAERETAYRHQLARESYEAGYRQAEADMAARWAQIARPVVHGMSHAELDERRYGPGGRAHFADPRPGDFPGRGAAREPEREIELEAG